jgi:hypothetical protein
MSNKYWGVCTKCYRWGWAPDIFKENKHFLKCECGAPMYLTIGNPTEAGYNERNKVTVDIMGQNV